MKLWTLKFGSKSIQTSLILRQCPPKSYKLLKFFISFVTTVKSRHATSIWKKLRWKSLCLPILIKDSRKSWKNFKSLYGFWGRCLKIRDVSMDFEPYFKVHNLVNVHPKKSNFYMVFGDAVSKLETFLWILNHISRSITWSMFTLKKIKLLYGFWGRCLKIRDVFEPYFKVHNLVNVHPKKIKLGQMTNLNMIFYVMVSDYRLVKIWNSPPVPWWISEQPIGLLASSYIIGVRDKLAHMPC